MLYDNTTPNDARTESNPEISAAMSASVNAVQPRVAIDVLAAQKTYANGTVALQPVNLRIHEGEFLTLLGPSGCGKSTLLKMIAGLLPATEGKILLWNQTVDKLEQAGKKMSFVFQSPTLMPWTSVANNVRLPLDLAHVPRAEANKRVEEALALVGLSQFANHLPRALSGGMQMRVSIARSLAVNPDVLLMDEPFGALDEITRMKLDMDLMRLWREKKLTVVFVTHSIQEAVFLSTRIVMMAARPGRIVEEFPIAEPYPRTSEFTVSTAFSEYSRQLQKSLLQASHIHDNEGWL